METNFISSGLLWLYNADPDTTVYNQFGVYAEQGDRFLNTSTNNIFICTSSTDTTQAWAREVYYSQLLQSDWNQSTTTALDYIKNKPTIPSTPPSRSQSSATRALNTIFQVSSTRWSLVRYSVDISTTVSLTGSQIGSVILEMATNAAFTTGVQTLQQFSNGNSGTLVVGLVLTQLNTACLSGDVPVGNYVRLRTSNVTGTPTFTYQTGQEVLV